MGDFIDINPVAAKQVCERRWQIDLGRIPERYDRSKLVVTHSHGVLHDDCVYELSDGHGMTLWANGYYTDFDNPRAYL